MNYYNRYPLKNGWVDADVTTKEWFEVSDDGVMDYLMYRGHKVVLTVDLERLETEPCSVIIKERAQ